MIKALMRAGLSGIALRLLDAVSGLLAAEPQIATLADRLADPPSGEIGSHESSHRYRRNLAILHEQHSPLSASLTRYEETIGAFRVYRSHKGNVHVLRDIASNKLDF